MENKMTGLDFKIREVAGRIRDLREVNGLSVEEMAGNIVTHGFEKDRKRHSVDLRIAYKDENLILRIKLRSA